MDKMEVLVRWMINEGCYDQWMDNIDMCWCKPSDDVQMRCAIDHVFSWSDSPEGQDYWDELDDKWRAYCLARGLHKEVIWHAI